MKVEWKDEWPTEPGHYWFWQLPKREGEKPRLRFVRAAVGGDGSLFVHTDGEFLYSSERIGKWAICELPEVPE